MVLEGTFMIRTSNSEIYKVLVQDKKYFKRQIELFISALCIGYVYDIHSEKRPNHDIIRLNVLDANMKNYKEMIDYVSKIICLEYDEDKCGSLLLSYADGGLEKIWSEYQTQGILDLPRLYEELKIVWPNRIEDILKLLEKGEKHYN